MQSIRELYRIGTGPSSSHTMAPRSAAQTFLERNPGAAKYKITLYGSLAATGKGHLTDMAIHNVFEGHEHEIVWEPEKSLPMHPNGMRFLALNAEGDKINSWKVYSIGGGALLEEGSEAEPPKSIYEHHKMNEILEYCEKSGKSFWEYVEDTEGKEIWDFLREISTKGEI